MAGFKAVATAIAQRKAFKPGGQKGKLHREIGVPVGQKIPPAKLEAAAHSKDRSTRDDAIRAQTMEGWSHVKGSNRKKGTPR